MVNSLSPVNAIDIRNKTLNLGANDYNGRILFRSVATAISTTKAVGIMQGDYANSIDSGDKLVTQTFSTATNIIPAIELPSFIDRSVNKYGANIYLADVYSVTYQSFNVSYTNGNLVGVTYVPDTRIPFGVGYTFYPRVMQTETETVFTGVGVIGSGDVDYDYLCYETGNDTPGQFQSFVLFGQTFLFDGKQIWFASFTGSLFSGKGSSPVAPAEGMALIASSPIRIYFLSSFDNSIYVFDGGRSLAKIHRMNQLETILNGVYSVRDNTLALQTADNFIWIRDDLISENAKKANQTAVNLSPTSDGVVIANNTAKWIYSFNALSSPASAVVPLDFQTAYFGLRANMVGQLTGWMVYIYSATKAELTLSYTPYAMDSDSLSFKTQKATQTITPSMFDQNGIALVRIQPQKQKAIAMSLEIQCPSKVTITKVVPEFKAVAAAVVPPAQSR